MYVISAINMHEHDGHIYTLTITIILVEIIVSILNNVIIFKS